jgi:hypothetical protein
MSRIIECDWCNEIIDRQHDMEDCVTCEGDFCNEECLNAHRAGCDKKELERLGQGKLLDINWDSGISAHGGSGEL